MLDFLHKLKISKKNIYLRLTLTIGGGWGNDPPIQKIGYEILEKRPKLTFLPFFLLNF